MAAVVLFSLWLGARRGLFRTLAELAAYVAAYLAAVVLTGRLAAAVAEWIRPLAEGKLREIAGDYLAGLREELPAFLELGEALGAEGPELGELIERGLYNLAYMLSFAVIFLAVLIALRLAIRAADLVTRLPLIHQVNVLGGLAIGAVKGLVIVWLLLFLAERTGLLIAPAAIRGSYLVPLLQRILPL